MKKLSFEIPEGEGEELQRLCSRYDITLSQALRALVRLALAAESDSEKALAAVAACKGTATSIGGAILVQAGLVVASGKGGRL